MDIKTCYERMGGDFNDVLMRFRDEARVQRFALRFIDDKSFDELKTALATADVEAAFRAAHTLKGVCQNLSFTSLGERSYEATEYLRKGDIASAKQVFPYLQTDYERTISALKQLQESL